MGSTTDSIFDFSDYIAERAQDFTGSKGLKYEFAQQLKGNGAIIYPEKYK